MEKNSKQLGQYDIKGHVFSLSVIIISTLIITYYHYGVPKHHTVVHISHYYAFYIIAIYASYKYGLKGGLIFSLIITIIYSPASYLHLLQLNFEHHIIPSMVQVTMVYAVAILAGVLSGKLRREKEKVEQVSREMLELERKVAQDNKLKAIGQLSAGVAHEIRNPLAAIKSGISLIKSGKGNEQVIEILSKEIDNLDKFIDSFLQYSRLNDGEQTIFPLRLFAGELAELVKLAAARQNVQIEYNIDIRTDISISADKNALKHAILNLVINGIEAAKQNKSPKLKISLEISADEVIFNITDNGKGVPPETVAKIFEPFFTTKSTGTGLGLALAVKTAKAHGGNITLENHTDGCTFSLHIQRDKNERFDY